MVCKECGITCYDRCDGGVCWVCRLLRQFSDGEVIDDAEELLIELPDILEELVELRRKIYVKKAVGG